MGIRFLIAAVAASVVFGAAASADIVVNHPPLNSGGPAADTEFINDSNMQSWQQLADDFQVTQNAVIRRISWWGFYGSSFLEEVEPPPATETMRVRFYSARTGDGLPDDANILFDESFSNPSRTATGRRVSVGPLPPELRYQVDLTAPFALQAGVPYWLEIVQVGDTNSHFRWEVSSAPQDTFSFLNPYIPDWESSSPLMANLAFQLSTVPEPSSLLLCLLGLTLWGRKKR